MVNHLKELCHLVHETQKERGLAALHLRGESKELNKELGAQFEIVDKARAFLSHTAATHDPKIQMIANLYSQIVPQRQHVVAKAIKAEEALVFYTQSIINPSISLIAETAILNPDNDPAKLNIFINFIQWKERVGQERAYGTQLVAKDILVAGEFSRQLQHMIQEQMSYERMVISLAGDTLKDRLDQLMQAPSYQQILTINRSALNGSLPAAIKDMSAQQWFSLFSVQMDILHEMNLFMLDNLKSAAVPKAEETELLSVDIALDKYKTKLKGLPIFSSVSASLFNDIMKQARVTSYDKGSLIFMEGEQATRFYIILDGWVKVFKGNANGEESVLQMMSGGDSLLETIIFSNTSFPVSAQAVGPCILLSIPAPIIREKVKTDNAFAMNMLSTVTDRSHQLISQFEQLTLKTVEQRVGWFLLKLFLDSKGTGKNLKLPYDKSLIASYLGMKKETFSRALQIFKENGIDIDKDTVSLPDVFALCDYCDHSLALKCSHHNTPECPNPDCSG